MADVIHRTTKQFLLSVNDPDYPTQDWIHGPIINGQNFRDAGVETKFVKISGDTLTEMTQGEKDAVLAAELENARDSTATELEAVEGALRAFALVVLDEINTLRSQHSLAARTIAQLKNAMRNKLGT